ncbi:hypothetical protein HK105_202197 [Polyrhizophydium stewartii]|uniref:Protein kinase domain-containing protein n=1 Tax=Polyrhizophydium stewartii TaxID=2732419 RepID=A0ABR4NFK6_9FUNG
MPPTPPAPPALPLAAQQRPDVREAATQPQPQQQPHARPQPRSRSLDTLLDALVAEAAVLADVASADAGGPHARAAQVPQAQPPQAQAQPGPPQQSLLLPPPLPLPPPAAVLGGRLSMSSECLPAFLIASGALPHEHRPRPKQPARWPPAARGPALADAAVQAPAAESLAAAAARFVLAQRPRAAAAGRKLVRRRSRSSGAILASTPRRAAHKLALHNARAFPSADAVSTPAPQPRSGSPSGVSILVTWPAHAGLAATQEAQRPPSASPSPPSDSLLHMPVIAERHQTHSPLSITADSLLTDDSSCGGPGAGAGTRPVTLPRDKFSGTPEPDTDTDAALAAMASAVRIQASPSCSSQDSFETLSSSSSSVISAHDARQMLNQYRIVSDLGEGAFSKVKLAKSTTTGAFFAIKFVDRALIASTPSYVENIAVEIEIMSSLSHPSVISFVELIETPTHQCLVTEYVPGIELFEYVLLQDEQLHESIVRSIFRQIAQAVAYLHENLVAHRDIKLENIMIDMSGGAGAPRIKLIDFGLATRISPPALLRERCGSEEYAAPELVQSLPYDGRKVDVWAMGIVLFSMLFKSMPFSCAQSGGTGTLRAMFHRIARADYRIPPDHARSPAAVDLLRAILVANPARRLASDRVADSEWLAG